MVPQTRAGCGVRENARELFEIRQSGKALGGLPWGLCAPAPPPPGPLDRELLLAPDGLPTPAHPRARPAAILVLPAGRVAPGRVAAALGSRSPGARHAPLPGAGIPAARVTPPRPAPARALRLARPAPQPLRVFRVLRERRARRAEPMEPARGELRASGGAESLLGELEVRVQDVVRVSSWWERHGVDCAILALSLLALPPGEGHGARAIRGPAGMGAVGGGGGRRRGLGGGGVG